MHNLFQSWKYIFKNIWFVLPFAIVPAALLALSLDYRALSVFVRGFFSGKPRLHFVEYFRVLSLIRIDSVLGGIYSVLAFVCVVLFSALMLAFVEKHMRIGKRSLSGVYAGFWNILYSSFVITLVYLLLYELWALIFSTMLFVIAAIPVTALVYIFSIVAFLFFTYALLYVVTAFYLWLPCRQMTGFGFYDAFLYSYRLMVGIRWNLVLNFLISFIVALFALCGAAMLPAVLFRIVGVILFVLLFLSFCIRMETAYFETDKLDREDILHSYKEY